MKILWVVKNFPPSMGGVQQYAFHYVSNMSPESCLVLTRKPEFGQEDSAVEEALARNQIKIYRMPAIPDEIFGFASASVFKNPLRFISFNKSVLDLVKKEKVSHVVFAHASFFYFFSLLPWKIKSCLPFFCIFHGEDIPVIKMKTNFLFRWLISRLDGYVCNSSFTQKRLESFMDRKLPVIIANPGVEEKFFQSVDRKLCTQQFGVDGKKVLYTVGRLDERKGHDLVIKALPLIKETVPDVVYLIGGKGPHLAKLQTLVDELELNKYVKFCGFVESENICAFHGAGDIFVMPNRVLPDGDTEGFGIVFLEAGAAGKPVIAGRAGGAVDAVVDEVTGYLVDPFNVGVLAQKIIYLLEHPRVCQGFGAAGKQRAYENYRWKILAEKFENNLLRYLQ